MKLRYKILISAALIAALVLPWQLFAGVCAQRVVKQRVVTYAQPVAYQVAYQQAYVSPYSYAIGSDLVLEALAEKLALRIEEKLVQRQQRVEAPPSIVAEKCAKCHSPQSRAVSEGAPAFFDQLGQLTATAEQRASMRTAAHLGAMPPPPASELTDEEFVQLKVELERGIVRSTDAPPPVSRLERDQLQEVPLPPTADGRQRTRPPENIPEPPPAPQEQ